jgi:hypothetical protein
MVNLFKKIFVDFRKKSPVLFWIIAIILFIISIPFLIVGVTLFTIGIYKLIIDLIIKK